jgi:DNA-binding transcriptional ArsR family regulator
MMKEEPKYLYMSRIMKAMAHPTRLYILDLLNEREHCVCELAELAEADVSTVSRHLSVLKHAGIIDNRKQNNQVWYRLLCPCVLDFYSCVTQIRRKNNV